MEAEQKKPWRIIATRTVWEKGGSLGVTIPSKVVDFLDLKRGEELVFIIDTENGYVVLGKGTTFGKAMIGGREAVLGTPLHEKEFEQIMKKRRMEE